MVYRGEDLDLRTPQTWGSPSTMAASEGSGGEALATNGQRTGYRAAPILVDDYVLACSNHAYDIALAHRAGEVRIEHLIYAMTRVDPAIDALESRGIRLAGLRRDAATVVASEIPVGLPNGKGSPRRSDDFAEVLRLASLNASRRNAPASIDDVLAVLIEQRPDLPGAALLARHQARPSLRDTVEPLPPLTRYSHEPRYARAPYEAPRYFADPRPFRQEYFGTPTDALQNSRIDALESIVRSLSSDLAAERQVVSGLLKDLSRETQAQRDDQGRLHSGLYDRMQTLEQAVIHSRLGSAGDALAQQLQNIEAGLDLRLQDMSQSWSVLSSRLQELEIAIRERAAMPSGEAREAIDLRPIAHRLDVIEEAVLSRDGGDIAERLKAIEGEITRALEANAASTSRVESLVTGFERTGDWQGAPIVSAVDELTQRIEAQSGSLAKLAEDVSERLGAVERAIAAEIETAAAKHQAYAHDLTEVHGALMKLNQNQHTLAGSIDQWRTEAAGDVALIANRLNALDRPGKSDDVLNALSEHLDSMNRMLVHRHRRRHRFWYWLFGTDDWIGASWPSQSATVESDRPRSSGGA